MISTQFKQLCFLILAVGLFQTTYGQNSVTDTTSFNDEFLSKHFSVAANETFFEAEKARLKKDNKKAVELYEKLVELMPTNSNAHYQLGMLYFNENKVERAAHELELAVKNYPGNKYYLGEYGNILHKLGKNEEAGGVIEAIADSEKTELASDLYQRASEYYELAQKADKALRCVDKALIHEPNSDELIVRKIQLLLNANETDKAALLVEKLISTDPKNGRYYLLLSNLYENSKKSELALESLKRGDKAVPGDANIQMGLANFYLSAKDTVTFQKYAKKAIVNKNQDFEVQLEMFNTLLVTLTDSNRLKEGMEVAKELLRQHPTEAGVIATYADFLYINHEYDKAIDQYKLAVTVKPSSMEIWLRLMSSLTDKERADTLVKYSEKFMRLYPNQFRSHYFNAIAHYNKKNYTRAVNSIDRAMSMAGDEKKDLADLWEFKGEIYNASKQFDESDKCFLKSIEYQPDNASTLNNYSYFLAERNTKLDDALKMSEKALKLRPDEVTFMDTYGWILFRKGDYAKAKTYFEKAILKADKDADATLNEHLGDVYFKLNDKVKALQYWKTAKTKGSENPLLDKKISEEKFYE